MVVNPEHLLLIITYWIGPNVCMRYHGTKCPLLTVLFLFLSFSLSLRRVTFLPEGVIVGFWNFAWGIKSQKNKILGEKNFGGPPRAPQGVDF